MLCCSNYEVRKQIVVHILICNRNYGRLKIVFNEIANDTEVFYCNEKKVQGNYPCIILSIREYLPVFVYYGWVIFTFFILAYQFQSKPLHTVNTGGLKGCEIM